MKKIVILVDQMHSHGGIEKLVAIKANYWSAVFGYDVTILSTEQAGKPIIYDLNNKVKFQDLAIDFNRKKSYFSIINILKLLKNIVRLQQFILKKNPDFILVASHIPMTYVLPFLITGKAKTIKEFHYTKFYDSNQGIKNKLLIFIESKYEYLVVLSKEEQSFYYSNNTVVIPNPIQEEVNESLITLSQRPLVAIAIVRFAPVKQLESMVEIWEQFYKNHPKWELHLYGSIGNEYYQKIFNLVHEKQLQSTIVFKGQTNEVAKVLQSARVLLMTSIQECFPMVILEANAVGVPVVSFNCPTGPRNIIHEAKDGFLIPVGDQKAFVNKLEQLSNNTLLLDTLGNNAKQNASNYILSKVMNLWNTIIFAKS
jgi:glycosyltransferase involved in cell wall biosynthesis